MIEMTGTSRRRTIAVCADDFGMHPDVDGAILELAKAGRVTTVSCLVGGASWRQAGPRLAGMDPEQVEAGLHLDLTWAPLPGGGWPGPQALAPLIAKAYLRGLSRASLCDQVERQLDAFERVMQRPPDHVDGHQHVHQLPGVRDALLEVLARRWPGAAPWLRSTRSVPGNLGKAQVIDALGGAALRRMASAQGRDTSARLLGVHGFDCDAAGYSALLAGWLRRCADGDVLMCHPGWTPGDPTDPLNAMRGVEWLVLSGPVMGELLQHEQVSLVPLSAVLRARLQIAAAPPVREPTAARSA